MKRRALVLPVVLVAVAVALAIPKLITATQGDSAGGQGGGRSSAATAVRVVEIQPERLEDKLILNGSLAGEEAVTLQSEVVGRVARVAFREGTQVQRGQLLVQLDDSELRAEQDSIATELTNAEASYQRYQDLYQKGLASEEQYDEVVSRRNVLRSRLELVEARLAKTRITAPFSGMVGLRYVSPGELLEQSTAIVDLVIAERLKLTFGLPEVYQTRLRENLQVSLRVAGIPQSFTGRVYAWNPRIDESSRTIQVRARVDNPERILLPGNFASVELTLENIDDALMVPSTALVRGLEDNSIYVVEDGKAVKRSVALGIRTRDQVQIIEGLTAGERVVYLGVQGLRDGQSVNIVEDSAPDNRTAQTPRFTTATTKG